MHRYKIGWYLLNSRNHERDLGVLVDCLSMSQRVMQVPKKPMQLSLTKVFHC